MAIGEVVSKRIPHITRNNEVTSKMTFLVDGKKIFVYCWKKVEEFDPLDNLVIGQKVILELENGYYRYKEGVTPEQLSQHQQIQHAFNGTPVKEEKKELDGNIFLVYSKLMSNCINSIRDELSEKFSSEDCRSAGISLFIYLTKATEIKNTDINKWMPPKGEETPQQKELFPEP